MLLLIPAIEISNARCAQTVRGTGPHRYSDDPVEVARLWRMENAKSLHITDLDGMSAGRVVNADVIRRIVSAIDIPVELGGGMGSLEAAAEALALGLYRITVTTLLEHDPDEARRILETFGPSKIVLGIDAVDGIVVRRDTMESTGLSALSLGLNAKQLGFRRILYTEVKYDSAMRGVNLTILQKLGETTGMRITAAGGITGLDDLLRIQELEPCGVDSVIVGRALYENRFSCQAIWRMCESGDYPFTAKV